MKFNVELPFEAKKKAITDYYCRLKDKIEGCIALENAIISRSNPSIYFEPSLLGKSKGKLSRDINDCQKELTQQWVSNLNYMHQQAVNSLFDELPQITKLIAHGPAGCGKTQLVNCLAKNAGVIAFSSTDFDLDGVWSNDIEMDIALSNPANRLIVIDEACADDSIKLSRLLEEVPQKMTVLILSQESFELEGFTTVPFDALKSFEF